MDHETEPQADHGMSAVANVDVIFRNQRSRLLNEIARCDVVLGCVAWLTDSVVLGALATRQHVSIVVQKEDFLRPDLGQAWGHHLRRLYGALPSPLLRYALPGGVSSLNYAGDHGPRWGSADNDMTPEEEIADIAARLLQPAGSAPVFQTADSINANREAAVAACHATWKDIHKRAIQRLLFFEGWLNREKTNPMGPEAQQLGACGRAVWRRVNDAIVWNVLGFERHHVKRLCLYRARSNLLECNPNSVIDTLDTLNRDPLALALWTDATSCVDLGDVFFIRDGRRPVPQFIELKEGAVNEQIIKVMDAARGAGRRRGRPARQAWREGRAAAPTGAAPEGNGEPSHATAEGRARDRPGDWPHDLSRGERRGAGNLRRRAA